MAKSDYIDSGDVTKVRHGNRLVLTSYTPLITTVDELVDFCEIDLDHWQIEKQILNAWTTPSKDREVDLDFIEGVATGTVRQSNDMRFAQNVQVKVWLLPLVLDPIHPAIQPMVLQYKFKAPKPPKHHGFTRHFVCGDHHFGFRRRVHDAKLTEMHDRSAIDVTVQIAAACKPDRIDLLGDWFEMTEFSKFLLSPEFYYTLQPAICESFFWLVQYAAIAATRLHQGNHDKRLPDAIKKYLPFAYGLRRADEPLLDATAVLSVQNLLALDAIGVEWVDGYPNDTDQIAPDLVLAHGLVARSGPIETSNAVAQGFISEVYGHIHKRQLSSGKRPDALGNEFEVTGCSPGCLCHTDRRVPGHTRTQHWSQGCAIIDVFDTGDWHIDLVAIKDGVAAWNGKLFTAEDRLDELHQAQPDWNW